LEGPETALHIEVITDSFHFSSFFKLQKSFFFKDTPDEVRGEDMGHPSFLLFSMHYLCFGQIFSRALTAKLKGELLCRAYCSFASNKLPVNYIWETVCAAKTYGHLIANTFTSGLPYT